MKRFLNTFLASLLASCLVLILCISAVLPAGATTQSELDEITGLWQTSPHALNDVNCASCHQDSETKAFMAKPDHESCRSCHEDSVNTFLFSKHGVRLLEEETPLTPAMARLPMKHDAFQKQMNCNACHDVHSIDTVQASVDACLTCHNDTHSLNYQKSKHAELFASSGELPRPGATAVTCATCHLPRTRVGSSEETAVVKVNHNNTYTLKPQDRMVGDVCINCHGVEYAYNSIFDADLVEANFDRPPTLSLDTFNLMRTLEERRSGNSSDAEAE